MIDPLISLAFSVYSNKGVYALLLGSGISRSAGIPTGWEVVEDLITQLARVSGIDGPVDPSSWHKEEFGEEPEYSKLLDTLAKSPTERGQLLRSYFEPSAEERERNLKTQTLAHKAIADLVSRGYVRVIVTTNFDRLLERALEAIGVFPIVISTIDAINGAPPLQHNSCTVIKVHGDYLDTRIRNTPSELAEYEPELNRLLDRIFDEYGLIVCGWSAEWDSALGLAINRCQSRRFSTYWAFTSEPSERAQQLITFRRAEALRIGSADGFFSDLSEKVKALEDLAAPHPLSGKMAVATMKRYLVDEQQRIKLHDLVDNEVAKLLKEISEAGFALDVGPDGVELRRRVAMYEALSGTLLSLIATGCYWGETQHEHLWTKTLERVANSSKGAGGYEAWNKLRLYPALLLVYGGGIAAIVGRRYGSLAALLIQTTIQRPYSDSTSPAALALLPNGVIERTFAFNLPDQDRKYVPVSEHLFIQLRKLFAELVPDDGDYEKYFDLFEAFWSLVVADLSERQDHEWWAPYGRFGWKYHRRLEDTSPLGFLKRQSAEQGSKWPALASGFFDGSLERFETVFEMYQKEIASRWSFR
jgi:hypothetical protein